MSTMAELPPAGIEALDTPGLDDAVAQSTLCDIARTNALFGGHAALGFGLERLTQGCAAERLTVLDVGAGAGDGTGQIRRVLGPNWSGSTALDHHRIAARMCRKRGIASVVGDIWHLPVRQRSFDIVVANLVLHHAPRTDVVHLVEHLSEMARLGVVIADLRRSAVAVAGFRIAGGILRFHEVTRHDGVLSIKRGFTKSELHDIIVDAGIENARVHRRLGWRLVAYWRTSDENSRYRQCARTD